MLKHGLIQRDGKLGKLGFAVNQYLAEGGNLERSKSSLCAEIWPQVVGHWYSRHSRVVSLNGKELKVCCDTAPLAQQLQYDQVTIIERLNERLGGRYVTSLRPASVGSARQRDQLAIFADNTPHPEAAELAKIELEPQDLGHVQEVAAQIPDLDRRERWLRTALRQIRLRKWQAQRGFRPCSKCGVLHEDLHKYCFACRIDAQETPAKGL